MVCGFQGFAFGDNTGGALGVGRDEKYPNLPTKCLLPLPIAHIAGHWQSTVALSTTGNVALKEL